MAWVRARLCKLQKGCIRLASDKVYQLPAHGLWFYPGTSASSTTKTGRHDIAEILLKMTLNTKNKSINQIIWKGKQYRGRTSQFQRFLLFLYLSIKQISFSIISDIKIALKTSFDVIISSCC